MLVESTFKPAFWLRNRHAQTIFASKIRPAPQVMFEPERLTLDDGDFLDLSWLPDRNLPPQAPVVIVLHGLNGGLDSKYARGLLREVAAHEARGVLLHFRGANKPNRKSYGYHSGETGDFATVIGHVRRLYPHAPVAAAGYSLGGNVLLKYLGEQGAKTPLECAVGVSVPFDLAKCAEAVNHGLPRIYRDHMLNGMRRVTREKFGRIKPPIAFPDLGTLRDFVSFDNAVTAPLNGFEDAADYYRQASSGPYLKSVRIPTLIIQSTDDPFMGKDIIPDSEDLAPSIRFEHSTHGGHVGFVAAGHFGEPVYWLEQRIPAWYEEHLPGFELEHDSPSAARTN